MKTVEAKTPQEVKAWVSTKPHYEGYVLTKTKAHDPHPGEVGFLVLRGDDDIIYIPSEVHKDCYLKPLLDGKFMYEWDDEAEAEAKEVKNVE